MPELPEVERGRLVADAVACDRTIRRARCAKDDIVYDGVTPTKMTRALKGRTVVAVHRRGKHLWFELDRRPWPCFHFGMTGQFRAKGDAPLPLRSSGKKVDTSWPPKFTKIHLTFDDGGELVMTNSRRLGRIRLREDPATEPPIAELGFDPLLDLPSPAAFQRLIASRTVTAKGLLMDQGFAAGVGNWIADEVLYQAKIDPRRPVDTLDAKEIARLRSRLKHVIDAAVRVDADKKRFPKSWLFHRRWGREEDAATAKGEPIVHITLAGRTTAWVPSVQR
jgi:formamidopyrimidine-DNA glycosylase